MKLEELINLIFENRKEEYSTCSFPRVVSELPDGMDEQPSDIEGVDSEWRWQSCGQFDDYHGELAYKLDDGRFLIFEYWM